MRRAPYASCVVLVVIGVYMAWHGWAGLQGGGHWWGDSEMRCSRLLEVRV